MKSLTRKLFMSVAVLAVAIVTMSTSTFAWFTMSGTAQVETISGTVTAGDGFTISLDGVNFKQTVGITEYGIKNAAGTSISKDDLSKSLRFAQITSLNSAAIGTDSYGITGATPGKVFKSLQNNAEGGATTANVDFLEFTVWFKTTAATAVNVYVKDNTTGYVTSSPQTFSPLANFTYGETPIQTSETITVNPANATRMAIIKGDNTDVLAIMSDKQLGSSTAIGIDLGGTITATDSADGSAAFAASAYYNVIMDKKINTLITPIDNTVVPAATEYGYITGNGSIISLSDSTATVTSKVIVRLWTEGWDGDSFDAIRNGSINIDLGFTSTESEAKVWA